MVILLAGLMGATVASGQAKIRKLPGNLNHPAINNYAPYISLDGNSLVYLADLGEDHALALTYSVRQGVNWKDPFVMPRNIGHKLNFMRGFGLSPDGRTLYLSNMKSNGMGGFDIYASQLKGTQWDEPVNMLLPVNSKENEACPSLSLDGTAFYYMRCDKMDINSASGCRILVMKKKPNGQWDAPVELPAYINSGNSQAPRIMSDGEMLIFSSDRIQPNRGGMDLYFTRLVDGQWSRPEPLDFANTASDDCFISSTSSGMYLLKDVPGQRSNELVEYLFPPEIRPKGTLKVEGSVTGVPDPSLTYITVYRLPEKTKAITLQPSKDGTFQVYMNYGRHYQLAIEPADGHYTFSSKAYDLRGESNSMVDRFEVHLEPVKPGLVFELTDVEFESGSSILMPSAALELSRISRMIEGNPDRSFSIEVTLFGFQQDSIRSNPDLTEVAYDTTRIPIVYQVDSATTATRDSIVVRSRFHNDRTLQQAKAIAAQLIKDGTNPGRLASSGKALAEAIPEKRRTSIQVIAH